MKYLLYLIFITLVIGTFLFALRGKSVQKFITPLPQPELGQNKIVKMEQSEFIPSSPDLAEIFSDNHEWIATVSGDHLRTIIATGDIIPARSVNYQTVTRNDFSWPYRNVVSELKKGDIVFSNLESPLVKNCQKTMEGMVFCGDTKNVEGLVYAGIGIVSLANNHAGNYGTEGINQTRELLLQNNIMVTGLGKPAILMVKGKRIAFLGFNDIGVSTAGIVAAKPENIQEEVQFAKSQVDIVIVTFHWGTEYQALPDLRQRELGQTAIDAGADLVIGNHPHWIQPVEFYHNKLITYAHGNLVFDQEWSLKTKQGVIGKYQFYDNQLINIEYIPIQIEQYGQPFLLSGMARKIILNDMRERSLQLAKTLIQE